MYRKILKITYCYCCHYYYDLDLAVETSDNLESSVIIPSQPVAG